MKRFGWLTDIHLNFLQTSQSLAFLKRVGAAKLDGLFITGDIGEADTLDSYLPEIGRLIPCTVYFVLGNHDFYGSNFAETRRRVREICWTWPRLRYLTEEPPFSLTRETVLIGHDGWADGREGHFFESNVELTDYHAIEDLTGLAKPHLLRKLEELGNESSAYFARVLPEALAHHSHVILLTHVPPFRESCRYGGKISNDDFLPHFCSRAAGETLREIMARHPRKRLTVLCGHTHGAGVAQIMPNLLVKTGGAEYGTPEQQEVILVQ